MRVCKAYGRELSMQERMVTEQNSVGIGSEVSYRRSTRLRIFMTGPPTKAIREGLSMLAVLVVVMAFLVISTAVGPGHATSAYASSDRTLIVTNDAAIPAVTAKTPDATTVLRSSDTVLQFAVAANQAATGALGHSTATTTAAARDGTDAISRQQRLSLANANADNIANRSRAEFTNLALANGTTTVHGVQTLSAMNSDGQRHLLDVGGLPAPSSLTVSTDGIGDRLSAVDTTLDSATSSALANVHEATLSLRNGTMTATSLRGTLGSAEYMKATGQAVVKEDTSQYGLVVGGQSDSPQALSSSDAGHKSNWASWTLFAIGGLAASFAYWFAADVLRGSLSLRGQRLTRVASAATGALAASADSLWGAFTGIIRRTPVTLVIAALFAIGGMVFNRLGNAGEATVVPRRSATSFKVLSAAFSAVILTGMALLAIFATLAMTSGVALAGDAGLDSSTSSWTLFAIGGLAAFALASLASFKFARR